MKSIDQHYVHQPVGAVYQDDVVTFTVWAPHAQSVHLILNEDRREELSSQPFGYWSVQLADAKPGDLYHFQVDDQTPRPDPASVAQPGGVHGPSEVIDQHGYRWHDQGWTGVPMSEMIIYELHVGTFTEAGTFAAIIEKLDYLRSLGINAIEIMPIAQFPGERNWGYDGVYPYAAQHSYGGALGLMQLVDACHQAGIAVILDVVYNHLGPEGNYLPTYGPYLTDKHHTPWGLAINMDDAQCDGVRHYFLQNALMWLRDFRIDGLRLDAIHAIKDHSARHFLAELSERVDDLTQETGRVYTLIGECDLNDTRYISPRTEGGYGLTGQWVDEFHHALHAFVTKEEDGYYTDFGSFDHILKVFKETYVYDGVYSSYRQRMFGNSAEEHTYDQFVVFAQNHDQIGNRMMGDRLTTNVSLDTLKLLAGLVLLSPSVPMLFMGEEYGEQQPFQYFVSHTDPELVEAVREGRSREFAYFQQAGKQVPDPQSEQTFQDSTLSWSLNSEPGKILFALHQSLIRLRKTLPALQNYERSSVRVSALQDEMLLVSRSATTGDAPDLYCLFNLGQQEQQLPPFTETALSVVIDSSDPSSFSVSTEEAAIDQDQLLVVASHSFQVYRRNI